MTNEIEFRLEKRSFDQEIDNVEKNVRIMLIWEVSNSGQTIKEHTYLIVPFLEGFLVEGFSQETTSRPGSIYKLKVEYSAEDNPFTDYDYAWIQEMADFKHPQRGPHRGQRFYLATGMKDSEKEILDNIEDKYYKILTTGRYW